MYINLRTLFVLFFLAAALSGCQATAPVAKGGQPKPAAEKQVVTAPQSEPAVQAEPQVEQKAAVVDSPRAELYVLPVPTNARIRVMNIKPKFVQGMTLPAGRYHIEVTAPGYQKSLQWITLEGNKMKRLKVELSAQ